MDKVQIVQSMQDYIREYVLEDSFSLDAMYAAIGYSKRHADRMFKELLEMTPKEYVKAIILSQSAVRLVNSADTVLNVALDSRFESHEGFTRAFESRFCISPSKYRKERCPIPLFVQYPISNYQALLENKEEKKMNEKTFVCMVTPVERPPRKLLYLPSCKAEDYFGFCQEKGCEWEGLLNSIPEKYETAALISLPDGFAAKGETKTAAGVELPLEYKGPIPKGYRMAELPPCTMLFFQSEGYEKEEDFCVAIESTYGAIDKYDAERYGYTFAYDLAPAFNFGAEAATGARLAVPAVKK